MKVRKIFILLIIAIIVVVVILFLFRDKFPIIYAKNLTKGEITYEVTYKPDSANDLIISILAKKVTLIFKKGKVSQIMKSFGFTLQGIVNVETNTKVFLASVLNHKNLYQTTLDGPSFGFDEIAGMQTKETGKTKNILGYKCNEVLVTSTDRKISPFYIYYTDKIKIDSPNLINPFKNIPGVLLEYQMSFMGINMKLVATQIVERKIKDKEFNIPDSYERLTRKGMYTFFYQLMTFSDKEPGYQD